MKTTGLKSDKFYIQGKKPGKYAKMCVCMCIYACVYICTHIYISMCVCVHTRRHRMFIAELFINMSNKLYVYTIENTAIQRDEAELYKPTY